MKEHAIQINNYGETSALEYSEIKINSPAANEVQIRHRYSGVNFADIYFRDGLYKLPTLPAVLGIEGVGIIQAVGENVVDLKKGQRVAYAGLPTGSYSSIRNISAENVIPLPDNISDETVAGVLLRGITAYMLLTETYSLKTGDIVLVQAAAGGLGLILMQWIKAMGAHVIGTVSNQEKAKLVKAHNIDHVILYREENFVEAVNRITNGKGVDNVIDGIGGETLENSANTIRTGGALASIGQVAGQINEAKMQELTTARAIKFLRPSVMGFMKDKSNYCKGAAAILEQLQNGLQVKIHTIFPLSQAALAHERLAAGKTAGSVLLDTSI